MQKKTFEIQAEPRIDAIFETEQEPNTSIPQKRETFFQISFLGRYGKSPTIYLTEQSVPSEYPLSEYVGEDLAKGRQADWEQWLGKCIRSIKGIPVDAEDLKAWIIKSEKEFTNKYGGPPTKLIANSVSIHCIFEVTGTDDIPVDDIRHIGSTDSAQQFINRLGFDLTVKLGPQPEGQSPDYEFIFEDDKGNSLPISMKKKCN